MFTVTLDALATSATKTSQIRLRNAISKIYSLILTNPATGTQQFRMIFERYRLDTKPTPPLDWNSSTEDELFRSFAIWTHALRMMYLDCPERLQPRHLSAFAEANGLLVIYQDIILWPGFFFQNKVTTSLSVPEVAFNDLTTGSHGRCFRRLCHLHLGRAHGAGWTTTATWRF